MSIGKSIAVTASVLVIGAAACFGGYKYLKSKGVTLSSGVVYVQRVQELNSAAGKSLTGSRFSGVIETQKTEDFKADTSKKIKAIKVKVGDEVKKGDVLFTYDLEQAQLDIDDEQIEYEKAVNDLETDKIELAGLQKEKATASADRQTSLTTTILSKQSAIARAEFDLKQKEAKIEKMQKALKNNKVKSTLDGIVKEVADLNEIDESEPGAIVKISRGDDFTIKATLNEQMISQVQTGMPVIIRSRIDDNIWRGTVSSIETKPASSGESEFSIGNGEEQMNSASKYNFYVTPENFDGLMLGQHIIIEPDFGGIGEEVKSKEGIWLYNDFFIHEDGKVYVWADNGNGRLEKREVKLGDTDPEEDDSQVVSGLTKSDRIAYPSEEFEVGLKTTETASEATVPELEEGNGDDEFLTAEGGNDEFDANFTIDDEDAAFDDEEDAGFIDEEGMEEDFEDDDLGIIEE